jgi:hypothetical protein
LPTIGDYKTKQKHHSKFDQTRPSFGVEETIMISFEAWNVVGGSKAVV